MTNKLSLSDVISRLFQVALALIPGLTGLLALANNIGMRKENLAEMVKPLLTMEGIATNAFVDSWRAVHSELLIKISYIAIVMSESLVGILSIIGIILMIRYFCRSHEMFCKQQAWARAACAWGILVWGLGFYVIGGDFFLSWLTSKTSVQGFKDSGLNYVLMLSATYLFLKLFQRSGNI